MLEPLVRSEAPAIVILIRLMVGAVFPAEGIQKLVLGILGGTMLVHGFRT